MYRIHFAAEAERDLAKLDPSVRSRILKRLLQFEQNAEHTRHLALKGTLTDLFKLRIGDYRVLYDLIPTDQVILVHEIKHRREVYRGR